jgi:hypothetical protein
MGALLVASVSSFTSCKDYDDDINSLKESVAKAALQSNLDALSSQVATVKSTADQALTTANAAATKSELSAAKTEALAEAAKGITNAATAQAAADAAKALAQEAKAAAESIDLSPYAKTTDVDGKISAAAEAAKTSIQAALANYLTADAIEKKLTDLKQEIADANEDQLEEMQAKVKNATEAVNSIWSAVSTVSLYAAVAPAAAAAGNPLNTYTGSPVNIQFTMNKIVKNGTWAKYTRFDGAASKKDGIFGSKDYFNNLEAYSANTSASFADVKYVKFPTSIIVRVSPTNAELKPEHIALIDGQGKKLDVVEVASVAPYSALLTRAGSASGLWEIKFNLTDAVDATALNVQKATVVKADKSGYVTAAPGATDVEGLFAVAINNTGDVEAAADRNIVSEYGINVNKTTPIVEFAGLYNLATTATENLNNAVKVQSDLTGATLLSAVAGRTQPATAPSISGAVAQDKVWTVADRTTATTGNAADRTALGVGGAIRINNGGTVTVKPQAAFKSAIKYYYIVRDDKNAGGSDASELNAWKSYSYAGDLGTLLAGDKNASFSVTIPETLVAGDFIGFRLFAVNWDGTLADPDGVPFEVWVGGTKGSQSISDTFTPTQNAGQTFDYAFTPTLKTGTFVAAGTIDFKNGNTDYNTPDWNWALLKADKTAATNFDEVAYVRFTTTDVTKWADGKTGKGTISFYQSSVPVNVIDVDLTKVMPTAFGKATWKTSQPGDPQNTNKYICYLEPDADGASAWTAAWNTIAAPVKGGFKNLHNAINNLDDANYIFVFENVAKDADNKYTVSASYPNDPAAAANTYYINIDRALVDGKTAHNAKWYYRYNNISSSNKNVDPSDVTGATKGRNWYVEGTPFTITFACALEPAVMKYDWIKTYSIDRSLLKNEGGVALGSAGTDVIANVKEVYTVYNEISTIYIDVEFTSGSTKYTAKVNMNNDLRQLIAYENSFDNAWFLNGTNKMFAGGQYYVSGTTAVPSLGNYFSASLTSNSNNLPEYFTSTGVTTAGAITLTPTATTQPTAAVPSTLTVKGYDAFGHVNEIIKLPISVHRN